MSRCQGVLDDRSLVLEMVARLSIVTAYLWEAIVLNSL
jgi:hypothetical protein